MTDKDVSSPSRARDAASRNWDAFHRAWHNGHKDYVLEAEKFNDFYIGDQWDASVKAELERVGRPALTLNEIMQVINSVTGHYGESRADVKFKPRRGDATSPTADVLTRLSDYIYDHNNYVEYVEPRMFEDGVIEDRGYIDVRMDFTENEMGEVSMRPLDPRMVVPDPDSDSADPKDWSRVFVTNWQTLDGIEAQYGKAMRRRLESLATTPGDTYGDLSIKYQGFGDDQPGTDYQNNVEVKAVRLIDHQYRKMTRVQELVHLPTGMTRIVPDHWGYQRVHEVAAQHGLDIRTRVRSRVRWTVSVDHVTLHDDWSPYSGFTVVPFFPIYRRGRPSGLVRQLIDPQTQLNKIESQILHTVNTTANSGWTAEAGSLVNMSEEELERRGAETGLVLVYGRNRQKPEKIESNQVPTGLDAFARKAGEYIRSIPGASSLLGHDPATHVSGVALDRAQGKALLGLQTIFNNLNFTRKLVAQRVIDCVQTYYTEHRVFYVTDWRDPEAAEEMVEINARTANGIVNDITVGQYDVVATSTPTRDTFEDLQFAQMMELRAADVMIPDHFVILASQLAGKESIAKQVKQMQGMGEPDQMQQKIMELELANAEANVAKVQAQVAELEGRAALNQAKAQSEVAGEEREAVDMITGYKIELARLQADLKKAQDMLDNKTEIAKIHAGAKNALTQYQSTRNAVEKEKDRRLHQRTAEMNAGVALEKESMHDQTELAREGVRAQSQERRGLSSAA